MAELIPSTVPASEAPSRRKRALLVLGMHRSGTSALTRVLSLMGANLPTRLSQGGPDNVTGFWEPAELIPVHDRLLAAAGSAWDDVLPIPPAWWQSPAAREFGREILAVVRNEFSSSTLFVVKDPRLCRLLPLWLSVLESFGADPACVLCFRNPLEVADSLRARNGFGPAKSALLWLRHVIEAEASSRGRPRSLVSYESLLADWRSTVERLGGELGLDWGAPSREAAVAVEAFLDATLRHEERSVDELRARADIVQWVGQAYDALLAAEQGHLDSLGDALDRIAREMETADRAYGPLVGELSKRLPQGSGELELVRRRAEVAADEERRRRSELAQAHEELSQAADRLRVATDELAAARKQTARRQEERASLERSAAEERAALRSELAGLERSAAEERAALQSELAAAREETARRQEERASLERSAAEERAALRSELAAAREETARRQEELASLQKTAAESHVALEEERARSRQTNDELSRVRAQREAEAARAQGLAEAIRERDLRTRELETQLSAVLGSTSWRITGPVRRLLSGSALPVRLAREGGRLVLATGRGPLRPDAPRARPRRRGEPGPGKPPAAAPRRGTLSAVLGRLGGRGRAKPTLGDAIEVVRKYGTLHFERFRNAPYLTGRCNVCGRDTLFFCDDQRLYRESLNCAECGTTSRYRSIARGVLRAVRELAGVEAASLADLAGFHPAVRLRVYDTQVTLSFPTFAYPIPEILGRCDWIEVECSAFKPDRPRGEVLGPGATNQNLEALTFEDGRFDVVITSDVMEHVRLAERAHREVARVLRRAGVYLFTVPHFRDRRDTLVRVQVTDPDDPSADVFLTEPEYHGDGNSADGRALSYRSYGTEIDEELATLGLTVEYSKEDLPGLGVMNTELFYCRKL